MSSPDEPSDNNCHSAQSVFDFGNIPIDDGSVSGLLGRNKMWTETLDEDYFEAVTNSQDPNAVSICCADSRVAQSEMFGATSKAGTLFTPSNIGNKAVSEFNGETIVDGNFGYALDHLEVETAAVVGHTDCGAITAAYQIATDQLDPSEELPGVFAEVEPLVPIVKDALADPAVKNNTSQRSLINQLAEYNVHRQIQQLQTTDGIPEDVSLAGFVYDFVGAYGPVNGRTILVNIDGETEVDVLRDFLSESKATSVGTLLDRPMGETPS